MVHLGRVATNADIDASLVPSPEHMQIGEDEFTSSVYGSRYASTDIPKHEMPEDEMPRDVAHRLIK